jgi:hypothetical protein
VGLVALAALGCTASMAGRPPVADTLNQVDRSAEFEAVSGDGSPDAADPSLMDRQPTKHEEAATHIALPQKARTVAEATRPEQRLPPKPVEPEPDPSAEPEPRNDAPAPPDSPTVDAPPPPPATVPVRPNPPSRVQAPPPRITQSSHAPVAATGAIGATGLVIGLVGAEMARDNPTPGAYAVATAGLVIASAAMITTGVLLATHEQRPARSGLQHPATTAARKTPTASVAVGPGSVNLRGTF